MRNAEKFMTILSDEYYQTKKVLTSRMSVTLTTIDRYIDENHNDLEFVYVSDGAVGRAKLAVKKKKEVKK